MTTLCTTVGILIVSNLHHDIDRAQLVRKCVQVKHSTSWTIVMNIVVVVAIYTVLVCWYHSLCTCVGTYNELAQYNLGESSLARREWCRTPLLGVAFIWQ
jgi:hypothetical protein